MGIPAIVIEQHPRVGDGWRKRYPSLFLHTIKKQSSCKPMTFSYTTLVPDVLKVLYQPYPSNWPEFTPRDKLAAWLEQYAESNDLIVWTSSKIESRPSYDEASGKWSIVVSRDGKPVCLQPKHLIWATGIFGNKRIPVVPGIGSFKGPSFHAMDYKGGEPFSGKNVIVVGCGNTGVDICQDLHAKGAGSVTLVQRSPQILVSSKAAGVLFSMLFPEHIPIEVCDVKYATMPVPLLREMGKTMTPWLNEFDKDMHDGVKKQGFRVWNGPDGSGALITTFERAGGKSIIRAHTHGG
jgi:cation diffusion facilitator CzcD-associated flavoprotein CzcO